MGAIMGGHVRVGLEDNIYLNKGELAQSNADQVARIRRILEARSLEVATPDDAREMLALKGPQNVGFQPAGGSVRHQEICTCPAGSLRTC